MASEYRTWCDGCKKQQGEGLFSDRFSRLEFEGKYYDFCKDCMRHGIRTMLRLQSSSSP